MKVLKFGGSSVADAKRIQGVVDIIKASTNTSEPCRVVVFSAIAAATDGLLALAKKASKGDESFESDLAALGEKHLSIVAELLPEAKKGPVVAHVNELMRELANFAKGVSLIKELSLHTQDAVLSFGERLSAYIIAEVLNDQGISASFVDARKIVRTDEQYGNARIDATATYASIQRLAEESNKLLVVTGFIGATDKGETTTLGRGGSDLTASIFGAALECSEIEIWTDVDGVMTADPRKVKEALRIPLMTYEEAMEMSHFGAKVIYPPTMMPALEKRIPIRIKNTFNPQCEGTLIQSEPGENTHNVRGISSIDDVALLNVQGGGMVGVVGIAERLFRAFAREHVNVILISQASSEHSICVAIEPHAIARAEWAVNGEFALEIAAGRIEPAQCESGFSVVAVVGENMRHIPGVSGRTFAALGKNGINVAAISQGSSERNISLVTKKSDVTKAVKCLHDAFFLGGTMTLNLYVVGVGLIGRELLSQIAKQRETLRDKHSLEVRVLGIANTKHMLFSENGIGLETWPDELGEKGKPSNAAAFVTSMIAENRPNSIFVDCTSSPSLINQYDYALKASISIVTPNKKANSAEYDRYETLRYLAKTHGAKFIYEANVGAGLPVLSTIKNLLYSGDRILKIEAILSGTLSFLFNELSSNRPFSAVVRDAMDRGYTEPDPRDDLSGMDVARKLLILGREIGLPMELSDIEVLPFVPQSTDETTESWIQNLASLDAHFESLRAKAEQNKRVLRFVATLEGGKGHARLIEVDEHHPCFAVSGSDNVVSITTDRYSDRPLVVKGPGAGAQVTAAQVFADIIRVSNHLN